MTVGVCGSQPALTHVQASCSCCSAFTRPALSWASRAVPHSQLRQRGSVTPCVHPVAVLQAIAFVPVALVCVFVCCVILVVFLGTVGHPGVLVWQCGLRQALLCVPCFLACGHNSAEALFSMVRVPEHARFCPLLLDWHFVWGVDVCVFEEA